MLAPPLARIKAATAAEVCQHFDLREETRPLIRDGQTPREFLDALLAGRKHAPAIDFLAHALPPREAIWWGCLCVQQAIASGLPPLDTEAFKAAARWVLDPSEDNRRAAQGRGEAVGIVAPAGALAMAAGWTGGSLAPPMPPDVKVPPLPPVPPGPFVSAKAVAGAILLASTGDPAKLVQTQRSFVDLGIGVAEGRFVWPEAALEDPSEVTRDEDPSEVTRD